MFEHPSPNNKGRYVFVEVPVQMLDTVVPEGSRHGTKIVERIKADDSGKTVEPANIGRLDRSAGNETVEPVSREPVMERVSVQKNMREFCNHIVYSVDGKKCMVMLAAKTHPFGRANGITDKDLDDWEAGLLPKSLGRGKWFDVHTYWEKLQGDDYRRDDAV